jgi:hypothetical protein
MIFVARPVSVLASTWTSALSWQERCFLCFMAPRGIVAAAVSSVMALSLLAAGYSEATQFLPATFLLVALSVLIYGLCAAPLAHYLGLSYRNPQGVLFIGADPWVRELAVALQDEGCPVCLIDTDWENIGLSRMAGLPCIYGSALTESTREQIDYSGLGRVLAVTSNNEVNSLACLRYKEDFGRREAYQLIIPDAKKGLSEVIPLEHRGRLLFNPMLTFSELTRLLHDRGNIKKTRLTKEFGYEDFQRQHEHSALPLFIVKPDGTVHVCTVDTSYEPAPTDLVISLLLEDLNPT